MRNIIAVSLLFVLGSAAETCTVSNAINVLPILLQLSRSEGLDGSFDPLWLPRILDPDSGINPHKYRLTKRKVIHCTLSETCYKLEQIPFCLVERTFRWRDSAGGFGTVVTGDYTLGDGRMGNIYFGPHPLYGDGQSGTSSGGATYQIIDRSGYRWRAGKRSGLFSTPLMSLIPRAPKGTKPRPRRTKRPTAEVPALSTSTSYQQTLSTPITTTTTAISTPTPRTTTTSTIPTAPKTTPVNNFVPNGATNPSFEWPRLLIALGANFFLYILAY
ncbi:hypothetical protein TWF694_001813 [Orbilia ellipsospora]|uniref:Uncharacterized protein n=1 Tax=Orbilia ellipsospora TaxID=2528407 RepID=A0AAV9X3R5_9PEZI